MRRIKYNRKNRIKFKKKFKRKYKKKIEGSGFFGDAFKTLGNFSKLHFKPLGGK